MALYARVSIMKQMCLFDFLQENFDSKEYECKREGSDVTYRFRFANNSELTTVVNIWLFAGVLSERK